MTETLRLQIITPEGVAYSADVQMVTLPAIDGEIGIYPQHLRLITQMVPGELLITMSGQDIVLAVGEGVVAVTGESVEILTDLAVRAEEMDEAAIEAARQRALARLADRSSEESIATVNATVAHALAQLRVRTRRQP